MIYTSLVRPGVWWGDWFCKPCFDRLMLVRKPEWIYFVFPLGTPEETITAAFAAKEVLESLRCKLDLF